MMMVAALQSTLTIIAKHRLQMPEVDNDISLLLSLQRILGINLHKLIGICRSSVGIILESGYILIKLG